MSNFEKIKQLRDLLVELVPEIDLGTQAGDAPLNELGLYLGLRRIRADSQFLIRTRDASEQKKTLAEYLLTDYQDDGWPPQLFGKAHSPNQVFFECGSTIDPIVGAFARELDKHSSNDRFHKPDYVIGNNLFILTALVDLVPNVGIVEGNLRTKYFGILPYADDGRFAPDQNKQNSKTKWQNELRRYARMCQIIRDSDVVYATCSQFSLLAGPLVGSRSNAIAKHAMYMGRAEPDESNQEFVLAFHFEKLIPLSMPLAPKSCDFPGGSRLVPTMKPTLDSCRCILGRPNGRQSKLAPKVTDDWHTKWCTRSRDRSFVAYELESAYTEHMAGQHTYFRLSESTLKRSWAECGRNVRILISLPERREAECADWLDGEVKKANELHCLLPNPIEYKLAIVGSESKIAELNVVPRQT